MKIRGGYMPRITGRPRPAVDGVPLPVRLVMACRRHGVDYEPAVSCGQAVHFGDALAHREVPGGRLALPAPAGGRVAEVLRESIILEKLDPRVPRAKDRAFRPERVSAGTIREALAQAGIWPFFWSSASQGIPALDGSDAARHLVIHCVAAEPFRARGKVTLQRDWEQVVNGIMFLPRLLAEYGTIHVVLTEANDPVARKMREALSGHAWLRLHEVPVTYPVENPVVISRALRRALPRKQARDTVWVTDVHAVAAVGACLGEGVALHQRLVAVGGPGARDPRHVAVRIGTPLAHVIGDAARQDSSSLLLRGGLFRGEPVVESVSTVGYDDDAFFLLPRPGEGEFMGFARPGFDRASILPCFASRLTGAPDRRLTASLRGERRPCIACGLCEKVCPMRLLPQVIHRYLYRDAIDDAERCGLMHCAGCNLCTFVCPSKIELAHQFAEARETLRQERADAEAMEVERNRREATKQMEEEHSEDWRQ